MLGLVYDRNKDFAVDPRLDAIRFTRKRKVGRPKNTGRALDKEQPLFVVDGQLQEAPRAGGGGDVAAGPMERDVEPVNLQLRPGEWAALPAFVGNLVQVPEGQVQDEIEPEG